MNNKIDSYAHITVLLWNVFEILTQRKKVGQNSFLLKDLLNLN